MPQITRYECDKLAGLPEGAGKPCRNPITEDSGISVSMNLKVDGADRLWIDASYCSHRHAIFNLTRRIPQLSTDLNIADLEEDLEEDIVVTGNKSK